MNIEYWILNNEGKNGGIIKQSEISDLKYLISNDIDTATAKQFEKTNPISISPQTCSGGKKNRKQSQFGLDPN